MDANMMKVLFFLRVCCCVACLTIPDARGVMGVGSVAVVPVHIAVPGEIMRYPTLCGWCGAAWRWGQSPVVAPGIGMIVGVLSSRVGLRWHLFLALLGFCDRCVVMPFCRLVLGWTRPCGLSGHAGLQFRRLSHWVSRAGGVRCPSVCILLRGFYCM